jgi:type IV pilus assembly protein PilY1
VTDPDEFSESQAQARVLWEFTDADDHDLGYTYSTPSIVKMSGDRWAVIFGNGYNNTEADGNASSTGQAALFILFFDRHLDGNWILYDNYVKIPVGVSDPANPNGLASPAAIDIDGDFDAEYIYAGDLRGTLWKFDVQDPDPKTWSAVPLFTATSDDGSPQPITSQPEVGDHPEGGVLVYFGTGKYIEKSDHSTLGDQTFYGIRDKLETSTALVSRSTLFPQTIKDMDNTRITTTETTYDDCTTQHNGWYVNLPTPGERQVTNSILQNKQIIFTTMVPSTVPCSFGGDSWIMAFDAICGNRLKESPFDLNDDQQFTDADKVGSPPIAVSGIKSTEGITSSPTIQWNKEQGVEFLYCSGSSGNLCNERHNPGDLDLGRVAWQQLK